MEQTGESVTCGATREWKTDFYSELNRREQEEKPFLLIGSIKKIFTHEFHREYIICLYSP